MRQLRKAATFWGIWAAAMLLLFWNASLRAQSRAPQDGYGKLPLSFEANQGQTDLRVHFLSRGNGYSLFLTDSEAVLALRKSNRGKTDVLRMQLAGASHGPHVFGIEQLPGKANYFIGNDPAKWRTNVPIYGKVKYTDVYPGVDLVYYDNQRQLEYDFVVAPGADPKQVRLHFAGATRIKLSGGGLIVSTKRGEISWQKPVAYQSSHGQRQPVAGRFTSLAKNTVGFALGRYDHSRELVIDPTLTYSTYLGGTGYHIPAGPDCCGDSANSIAVDSAGSAYITGMTGSSDFPVTANAPQRNNKDAHDIGNVFVTKLDPTGALLLYSTYLGGTGDYWYKDSGQGIAVDSSGSAYVTGFTGSSNFPVTTGAYQTVNRAIAALGRNAFVSKLSTDGSSLLYSTYLGGSGFNNGVARDGDFGSGIAVDSSGNAFVTGSSFSQDFPVSSGAFQITNKAWPIHQTNPFVTKLNAAGSALFYSTYLGGSGVSQNCCYFFAGADYGTGIAIDGLGNAYVTGYAHSKDFPVSTGALQPTNHAHNSLNSTGASDTNAFITKLNSSGTALFYSTYLGGSGNPYRGDQASGIAVDADGYAYITGQAGSLDFPTTRGAFKETDTMPGFEDSTFVSKLNLDGTALLYSTYLSGSGQHAGPNVAVVGDIASGIAVDAGGQVYVVGTVISSDFPVTGDAFQKVNNETDNPSADYYSGNVFVTQLNANGSGLGRVHTNQTFKV